MPEERIRCPVCGKGHLEQRVVTERFDYGEGKKKVRVVADNVPVQVCTHCQETFSGPKAGLIRHRAICRALGLLTPEEICAIRERLGLSQAQFAKLTDIGEATISRWERGRLLQNKAMDRYLRLLDRNPDNVRLLEELRTETQPHPRSPAGEKSGLNPPRTGVETTIQVVWSFRRLGDVELERYRENRDQLLKSLNFAGNN
jgi:putative zinc finger/helix-turn-helix YgiT family protein